jgi:limonene-1,2-epoxide hydrolase
VTRVRSELLFDRLGREDTTGDMMDAEAVVRALCDAFPRQDVDELLRFFTDDAVYEKIPVGRFAGHDEIRGTLELFFGPEVQVAFEILNLGVSGDKVFVERLVHFETPKRRISLPAMAIFEVTPAGKIVGWRDYFDRGQAGLS